MTVRIEPNALAEVPTMSLRDDLASVLASDPRYSIQAYLFLFEALEHTKALKKRARKRAKGRSSSGGTRHVTGQELCEGARSLALDHYGMMALPVLASWGIHRTADLGAIVENLIEAGDLERSPHDSLADFDDVYDFEAALRADYAVKMDHLD